MLASGAVEGPRVEGGLECETIRRLKGAVGRSGEGEVVLLRGPKDIGKSVAAAFQGPARQKSESPLLHIILYMIREILAREAPSLFTLLSVRARLRGLFIDSMTDGEIIEFVRREMGEHMAELLQRIASRHD